MTEGSIGHRSLKTERAIRNTSFTAWDGNVASLSGTSLRLGVPGESAHSPTRLELWAKCPFRYYLQYVLEVPVLDRPEEVLTISPLDRGLLMHNILERFIRSLQESGQLPNCGEPWVSDHSVLLMEIAEEEFAKAEARGITGRPLLWDVAKRELRDDLSLFLKKDSEMRAEMATRPIAVEWRFGFGEAGHYPPVALAIGRGQQINFRGVIDRVDADASDSKLFIVDYKTGSSYSYRDMKDDPLGTGTHLQLPVYALAVRSRFGQECEIQAAYWFISARGGFETRGMILSDDEQRCFHLFEKELSKISSNPEIRKALPNFSTRAVALNYRGCLRPVHQLIRANEETKNLYLNEDDLINRSPSILDRLTDWRSGIFPSSNQVLAALKQEPQRENALLARLQGYLKAAKLENKDDTLDDIKDIKCIPYNGHLRSPNELAFKSIRGDYWGNWKHLLSGKGLSADVQKVYVSVGVIRSQPTPDTSLAYFRWLNTQNSGTIAANLACIIRQIDYSGGPRTWSGEHPDIPFIPVEVSDENIRLLSINQAVRPHSNVVVPDFDELVAAIRSTRGNRGAILAITSHPMVRSPISSYLRMIGMKSLREFAGVPEKVEGIEARPTPKSVISELVKLRSPRVARELRKRLEDLDLGLLSYPLRTQWRDRLGQIQGVRVAHSIMGTFKVGRRRYILPMTAAYDEQTGIIWLADSERKLKKAFFRVVADLIFVNQTKFLPVVLEEALRRDFWEEDLYSGEGFSVGDDEDDREEDDDTSDDSEPGAADKTHQGVKPDLSKNLPRPGPIPAGGGNKTIPRNGLYGRSSASANSIGGKVGRLPSSEEDKQIEDLKRKQYAYHCQVCLAERSIEQLAPTNSYVELQENRSKLIVAHHPDQVHAGGARHAGNMLILCSYHHTYIGDAISRDDVTDALKKGTVDKKIIFSSYAQGGIQKRTVNGKVATINIPLSGETIQCFFTDYHADYWLQRASS